MPSEHVILITGCSSGIGRATAIEAAARGHRVFATARNPETLRDLESRGQIRTLALDVTDAASIRDAVAAVLAEAGHLDALVNNAGYGQYGAAEDVTAEEWRRQFDVNLFGAIEVARAVLPAMREKRRGTIVNVSSVAGKIAIPFAAPYCASKHALEAFSDALRVEVAPSASASPSSRPARSRRDSATGRVRASRGCWRAPAPTPPSTATPSARWTPISRRENFRPRPWPESSSKPSNRRTRRPATGSRGWLAH